VAGLDHRPPIAQVGADGLDAQGVELQVASTAERADAVPSGRQLLNDVEAQESAGACDKSVHLFGCPWR
jgi:hypothetical protein